MCRQLISTAVLILLFRVVAFQIFVVFLTNTQVDYDKQFPLLPLLILFFTDFRTNNSYEGANSA
jgi:hypothetical protein